MFKEKNRLEVMEELKELYKKGYRYAVRDMDMPLLVCFSLKPKRYRDIEAWGYVDGLALGALPAYPIKNRDITEINYNNRSATLIRDFINDFS